MTTHFIAIEITDRSVRTKLEQAIDLIKQVDPVAATYAVDVYKSHVTLLALTLSDQSVPLVKEKFEEVVKKHISNFEGGQVKFDLNSGVTVLNLRANQHQILCAKVKVESKENSKNLENLVLDIKKSLEEVPNVSTPYVSQDKLLDNLHMSILNTLISRNREPESISESVIEKLKDFQFGTQAITSIQLLCRSRFSTDGYYFCEREIIF